MYLANDAPYYTLLLLERGTYRVAFLHFDQPLDFGWSHIMCFNTNLAYSNAVNLSPILTVVHPYQLFQSLP